VFNPRGRHRDFFFVFKRMFISSAKNFFIRRQVWSLYCKQRLCQCVRIVSKNCVANFVKEYYSIHLLCTNTKVEGGRNKLPVLC